MFAALVVAAGINPAARFEALPTPALVATLGDPGYTFRQRAETCLLARLTASKTYLPDPAVVAGCLATNPEVAARCRYLLNKGHAWRLIVAYRTIDVLYLDLPCIDGAWWDTQRFGHDYTDRCPVRCGCREKYSPYIATAENTPLPHQLPRKYDNYRQVTRRVLAEMLTDGATLETLDAFVDTVNAGDVAWHLASNTEYAGPPDVWAKYAPAQQTNLWLYRNFPDYTDPLVNDLWWSFPIK